MLSERKAVEIAFPKLYGICLGCGTARLKRRMTTVYLRPPGEKAVRELKRVGFICPDCLPKLAEQFGIEGVKEGDGETEQTENRP